MWGYLVSTTLSACPHCGCARPPDKITLALAVLRRHPEWTDRIIAERVGCTPSNLSKSVMWRAARKALKFIGRERAEECELEPMVLCASCEDPAGIDANGRTLRHDGEPRCLECYHELKGIAVPEMAE
jgi:hypothetical protein